MTETPTLSYRQIINALRRAGFVVVKKTTLAKIIKDDDLSRKEFSELV